MKRPVIRGLNPNAYVRRRLSSPSVNGYQQELPNVLETFLSGCSPDQRREVYDHFQAAGIGPSCKLLEEIGDEPGVVT